MHNPVHNRTIVLTTCLFVLVNVKLLISRPFQTNQTPITLNGYKYFVRYGQSTIMHNPVHNLTIVLTTCLFMLITLKLLISRPFYINQSPITLNGSKYFVRWPKHNHAQSCAQFCTISQLCAQVKFVSLSQVSALINSTAFITVLMGQWYINQEVLHPKK